MKRSWVRRLLLLAGSLVFQMSPGPSAWGMDLPLVFTALVGVRCRLLEAVAWGALAGLLQDLLSACGPGPHMAANCAAAFLAFVSHHLVFREKVATQAALIGACMILHQTILWFLFRWTMESPLPGDALVLAARSVIATTLVGAFISVFVIHFRRRRNDPATA